MNKNIFSKLENFSNRIALIDENGKKHIYKKLLNDAKNFDKFFQKKKLIIIFADNSYPFVTIYISAIKNNQSIILADPSMAKQDLNILVKNYQPDFIFSKLEFNLKNFKKVENLEKYYLRKNLKKKFFPIHKELSVLISTSGTTGSKKYVKLSNINIHDNTEKITEALNISKNDRTITTMPPFYSYALSVINTHLENGASIVLNKHSLIDKKFWELMQKFNPNNINGVPYFFEILSKIGLKKLNLKNLKYITQAGGMLQENIKKEIFKVCKKNEIDFFVMYGQTEASPRMTIMPLKSIKENFNSVGLPLRGGKILIKNKKFNNNKKILEGEIIYKGKNVYMGYSKNYKDLKKKKENRGILDTGDIGYMDKNFLYITGRKKRIIKIFGIRISLDQLEDQLKQNNFYCACLGNDKKLKVLTIDNNKPNIQLLSKKIQEITRLLPKFYEISVIKNLKRNNSGKVLYK